MKFQSVAKLLLTFVILNTLACAFKEETPEEPKAPETKPSDIVDTIERGREQQATEIRLTTENVQIRYDELPNPNSYQVVITWPANIKRMQITEPNELPTLINDTNEFSRLAKGGANLRFGLSALDSFGVPISTLKIDAAVPLDFDLNSDHSLKASTTWKYNRFYVRSGSQIKTNGHDLLIDVNKLYVEPDRRRVNQTGWSNIHSYIITHFPGEVASETQRLIGSNIVVRANEAHGALTVALVGISGKNGKSGEKLERERGLSRDNDPKLRGVDGIGGSSTEIQGRCRPRTAMDTQSQCGQSVFRCDRQPTNGTNGLKGANGTNGEHGTNGGNAGDLQFFVENHRGFKVDVFVLAGKKGLGGAGSAPFNGGQGGKAGPHAQGCTPAKDGLSGQQGDTAGANGKDGADGNSGTIVSGGVSVSTFPF